jgi:hypothetical protein
MRTAKPYAERVKGAVRERKRARDRARRAEMRLALQALNILRGLLAPSACGGPK